MCYIGLDISTRVIGISVLDDAGNILKLEYLKLEKIEDFWEKASFAKKNIIDKLDNFNPKLVFVEQSFTKFSNGMSSAQTIDILAKFNGIISFCIFEHTKKPVVALNVNEARKLCGIKLDRKDKSKTTKEKLYDWFKSTSFSNGVELPQTKSKKGAPKPSPVCYDMVDAFIVASAGIRKHKNDTN